MSTGLDLVQGSEDWLAWRRKGIGSSDAPAILGTSPYATRFDLWKIKTGRSPEQASNWAMERGNNLEPKARAQYELLTDLSMDPALFIHPGYDWLRASLDGYNDRAKRILEIKAPGKEDHAKALAGEVPEKYRAQIQHQLMITQANVCHYYSYDGEAGALVEVLPDKEYQEMLFNEERKFWELVQSDTAPELVDEDTLDLTPDHAFSKLLSQWGELELERKTIEASQTSLKDEMKKLLPHARTKFGSAKVLKNKKGIFTFSLEMAK